MVRRRGREFVGRREGDLCVVFNFVKGCFGLRCVFGFTVKLGSLLIFRSIFLVLKGMFLGREGGSCLSREGVFCWGGLEVFYIIFELFVNV